MIRPGKQVKVRLLQSSAFCETSILTVDEKTLSLALPFAPKLELFPGDEVKLEVAPREEGNDPLVFQAGVLEVNEDRITLQILTEPLYRGHRSSERIEAAFKTEYVLLSKKRFEDTLRDGNVLNISQTGALIAVNEPLSISERLLLLFDIALLTVTKNRVVPTAIKGEVVREHISQAERDSNQSQSYGVKFEKQFTVLSK